MQRLSILSGQHIIMTRKSLILSLLIFFIVGCHKRNSQIEHTDLIGKWKLTESLADPGDGSGTWQPADPIHPSYIEFNSDGTLAVTPYNMYAADRYKILSDSTMLFIRSTDSLQMRYEFSKSSFILHPRCYEACGQKYIAIE
jgi:hypothetical protein